MFTWSGLKKFFTRKDGQYYSDIAQRVAGKDELVKSFVGEHKDCNIKTSLAGDRAFIEYLSDYHNELSEYTKHLDRLFCVSFDSLPKGRMGTPERPMIRVYVDVKTEKVVTMDVSNYRQVVV